MTLVIQLSLVHIADLTNKPTIPTNTNELTNGAGFVTSSDIDTAINNLVSSAPSTLNTLNELAAALNDDADFAGTMTTALWKIINHSSSKYIRNYHFYSNKSK